MKLNVYIILLSLGLLIACEKDNSPFGVKPGPPGSYSYQSYDSLGIQIVYGWLKIESIDSVYIKGSWQLTSLNNRNNIGPQVGEGMLLGYIEGTSISMELNPQYKDNNLSLVGIIENNCIEGKWYWMSYSGVTNWGTFKAVKN
ncbi:hypothetical protein JXQ31_17765 [candidate division KSB1 bacterium]|nr:hypothetical protein [candidate division KSB1 bacterium]